MKKSHSLYVIKIILNIKFFILLYIASASNVEEDLVDFSKSAEGKIVSKKSFIYQPISCRFGRFGSTVGQYVNRTIIKCLTPNVGDVKNQYF